MPRKSRKGWWIALAAVVGIVLAIGLTGFLLYQYTQQQNELAAYENAIQSKEPAVLQNFLDNYASASKDHRDTIAARLEALKLQDLEWNNVVRSQSKSALMRYMKLHPESIHITEARLIVDSLDWVQAISQNTLEAYKNYMSQHQDGLHYDDAKMNCDNLSKSMVTPEEQQMITQLFTNYFNSLAHDDESGLLATLGTVIRTFLNRQDVTTDQVVNYMRKLHEAADITGMSFLLNNDWKIEKIENYDTGEMEYAVTFSVNQHIDRSDADKEREATYRVSAKVSPEGRIVDLNMRKIVK